MMIPTKRENTTKGTAGNGAEKQWVKMKKVSVKIKQQQSLSQRVLTNSPVRTVSRVLLNHKILKS